MVYGDVISYNSFVPFSWQTARYFEVSEITLSGINRIYLITVAQCSHAQAFINVGTGRIGQAFETEVVFLLLCMHVMNWPYTGL